MLDIKCNYDGGDCCRHIYIGDGNCHNFNNFASCGYFDGGDCIYENILLNWPNCPLHETFMANKRIRNGYDPYREDPSRRKPVKRLKLLSERSVNAWLAERDEEDAAAAAGDDNVGGTNATIPIAESSNGPLQHNDHHHSHVID